MSFIVYFVLDICDGCVVCLLQGDYIWQIIYGDDLLLCVQVFVDVGVSWMYLVDFDVVCVGGYIFLFLFMVIIVQIGLKVQIGGGVCLCEDVVCFLQVGVVCVVVGFVLVCELDMVIGWLCEFGVEWLMIVFDVWQVDDGCWLLLVYGWIEIVDVILDVLVQCYVQVGMCYLLCIDIVWDGMLFGLNIVLYWYLLMLLFGVVVQVFGGVCSVVDVVEVKVVGCGGVILGKVLLEGCMSLVEVLVC